MIKQTLSEALKMIKLFRRFTHFRVTGLREAMGKASLSPVKGLRKVKYPLTGIQICLRVTQYLYDNFLFLVQVKALFTYSQNKFIIISLFKSQVP